MRSFYEPSNHYWIVGDDRERLWSSESGGYVPADDPAYLAWLATERLPTRIATEEELDAVLIAAGRGAQAPHPPKRTVAKSVIVSRLIAAGKIDAAKAALEA
ncbi:MAG: hypothetical protein J0H08_13720, partial [Rhizobiales bacterium]|nr:hypothetical protein [Hyphomicrobiales bacterium]